MVSATPSEPAQSGTQGAAAPALLRPQASGWWGKLPSQGDFVGDGLPPPLRQTWDGWLLRALAHAQRRLGHDALRSGLLSMPPWQCLVVPDAATDACCAWAGVVLAACDRVGRVFPLLLAEAYPLALLIDADLRALQQRALRLADWLDQVGVLATPADFDAGVRRLADEGWPTAAVGASSAVGADPQSAGASTVAQLCANHPGAGSFWWRPEPFGPLPPPRIEPWPPHEDLLLAWLGAAGDGGCG
jgi:type VI secretion system protein ImpM